MPNGWQWRKVIDLPQQKPQRFYCIGAAYEAFIAKASLASSCICPMLTTASITTETFSAALLGLEDLSLRLTAAALHVAANPEKHPRLRLMLADLSEVLECCEEDLGLYEQ